MQLLQFILKKLVGAIFVLFIVTLFVSYAIRFSGDPAVMISENSTNVTVEQLQNIRVSLGIDKPFYIQYINFIEDFFRGDLGKSFYRGDIFTLIKQALPATLILAFTALILSIIVSIPIGIYAAVNKNRFSDQLIRIVSLIGLSFPNFWLGIMLVMIFSIWLPIFDPSGFFKLSSLVLPSVTLAIILSATNIRLVKSSMLETLSSLYIMVARSKGLNERVVIYKHALRNSLITLITYFGLQFGGLIGGVVIIEMVFNWQVLAL